MKKLVMSVLTLLTCGAAYALPLGNPSEASLFTNGICWESTGCCNFCDPCFSWCDAWSFRVGFYGDYVFDRHLEAKVTDLNGGDLQKAEIYTNAAYLALNLCDRLDVFATLGQTNFYTRQNTTVVLGGNGGLESALVFNPAFSWSIGARATLWECDCFSFGIEGQYFRAKPDLDHSIDYFTITVGDINKIYFDGYNTKYQEWQVGLGVSYRFATSCPSLAFVPYTGIKYSGVHWSFDDSETVFGGLFPNLRAGKHWGWALGATITMCDLIGFTVEGRWADEKAVYVNGQIRF